MEGLELEVIRRMSRAAFNQTYRLECMLAIADSPDGVVCLSDLAQELSVSISNVQKPLASLLALRLISPTFSGDSKRRYYLRNPSTAWAWARELAELARVASATRI